MKIKMFNRTNFLHALPLGAVLFVVTTLFLSGLESAAGVCTYKYGLFQFLHLMRDDLTTQRLNVFQVMGDANEFFVSIPGLAASILICWLVSMLLASICGRKQQ